MDIKSANIFAGHAKFGAVGARGIEGVKEEILNRLLAEQLKQDLIEKGYAVNYFAIEEENNSAEELRREVYFANKNLADLNIFIHFNCSNGQGKGAEILSWDGKDTNGIGNDILDNFNRLGLSNRGFKRGNGLYVIKHTKAKSMLLECCFIDNQHDFNILREKGIKAFSKCISDAFPVLDKTCPTCGHVSE